MKILDFMRLSTSVFLLFGVMPSGAFAQAAPPECACALPIGAAGVAVGSVGKVSGDVMMSMPAGFGSAKVGAPIVNGSRILVGPKSSASLSFGYCSVVAPAGSTVSVQPGKANTCVKLEAITTVTTATEAKVLGAPIFPLQDPNAPPLAIAAGTATGASAPLSLAALAALGLSVVGLGVVIAVDVGDDESVSR